MAETCDGSASASFLINLTLYCWNSGYESDLERDETYRQQQQSAEAISQLEACNRACEADELGQESFVHENAWMDRYRKGVVTRCASHNPVYSWVVRLGA